MGSGRESGLGLVAVSAVEIEAVAEGFGFRAAGKAVSSPGGRRLVVPTRGLAEALVGEIRVGKESQLAVKPPWSRMLTLSVFACDVVPDQRSDLNGELVAFGETDLLLYRAEEPEELVHLQARLWDPLVAWAEGRFAVSFTRTSGVRPVEQPEETVAKLGQEAETLSGFVCTGLVDLVRQLGSLLLGFTVLDGRLDAATAWELSILDSRWQGDKWGRDEEAERRSQAQWADCLETERFLRLVSATPERRCGRGRPRLD